MSSDDPVTRRLRLVFPPELIARTIEIAKSVDDEKINLILERYEMFCSEVGINPHFVHIDDPREVYLCRRAITLAFDSIEENNAREL